MLATEPRSVPRALDSADAPVHHRYWWLVIIALSIGGWSAVLAVISLIVRL